MKIIPTILRDLTDSVGEKDENQDENKEVSFKGPVALIFYAIILALLLTFFVGGLGGGDVNVLEAPNGKLGGGFFYNSAVKKQAVETDTLNIGKGCSITPLVLRISEGDTLKISNTDTISHTLSFEDDVTFTVSGGVTREINLLERWNKGQGIYRYKCNDISIESNVGVLYVTR